MSAIINALRSALEADPSNWLNRHALVEAYWKEGRRTDARLLLNEIQELPEDEVSLVLAAQSWAMAGSTEDGRTILRSVLEKNPANWEAHLALASIAHEEGDAQTATRHYITATSLNPTIDSPELNAAYGGLVSGPAPTTTPPPASEAATPPAQPQPQSVAEPRPISQPVPISPPESPPEGEIPPQPVAAPQPESEPQHESETQSPAESAAESAAVTQPLVSESEQQPAPAAAGAAALADTQVEKNSSPEDLLSGDKADTAPPAMPGTGEIETQVEPGEFDEIDEDALSLNDEVKARQEELERIRDRQISRDKLTSVSITVLVHVGVFILLGLAIVAVPRSVPPQIVASAGPPTPENELESQTLNRPKVQPSNSAAASMDVLSVSGFSPVAVSDVQFDGNSFGTEMVAVDFQPSMSFGNAPSAEGSMMMFGQKIEGEVLGVILDVSGSMAEYLPLVIREVDRNLKNAPIVYVNHAGILGRTDPSRVYPVIKDEVRPSWPRDWGKGSSPYWFLWGDLPRKAPQRAVDRLIDTFKTRPNMFIVRGGNNRLGSAAEFLIEQKIDSLYIFSDFEDFVDEEYCLALGQQLGRNKVRTYVQPAAARTEHLWTVTKKVARRSRGRELPPLTELLRPQDAEPDPIGVAVVKETPIPEGVTFATPREARDGKGVFYSYRNYSYHKEWYGNILKIVEYPNFTIVLRGPEARAYIYMKTPEGYIQNPIVFGYSSRKPYLGSDDRWHTRKRKFLRHAEEPKFEDGEFTWKMILEDEILFEVIFWFKEDSATGTYVAEKPPNGEGDGAGIFFVVPPVARESKDRYFSVDFPEGLTLKDLRLAMTNNIADFYLPAQAKDRYETSWNRIGFKKGSNQKRYNVIFRDLPHAVREVTVSGPSFGPRKLKARTTSNKLLLTTGNRADMELWEGFSCRLTRPSDRRERKTKTEAIEFSVE